MGKISGNSLLLVASVLVLTMAAMGMSNWLAPTVVALAQDNTHHFLNLAAPAMFGNVVEGIAVSVEPWQLLGMQLPAFATHSPPAKPVDHFPADEDPPVTPALPSREQRAVGIYHSHTTEAFAPTSGAARSNDFNETVVALGRVIKEALEQRGFTVLHREDHHDTVFDYSYINSYSTAEEMIMQQPNMVLLIDIHRDGYGNTSDLGRPKTTAEIDGRSVGRILLVVGQDHPDWRANYHVAHKFHLLMEQLYPGFSRGIILRSRSSYNQELHPGAMLVEIGGHWNTLDEAIYGAQLFAEVVTCYLEGAGSD